VNLYSQKQIENNLLRKRLFEKIYDANYQTSTQLEEHADEPVQIAQPKLKKAMTT
jgi:hypothetical protein